MSSKLITGETAAVFEPMPWKITGSGISRKTAAPSGAAPKALATTGRDLGPALDTDLAKLEQDIDQARAAARAEGEAFGRQQAQAELQPVLQKLAAAIQESADLRGRLRAQAESDLVRLSLAIAKKILGREINMDPEAITGVVKACLEKMRMQEVLRVRLHPEHRQRVTECLARLGATHVEVLGDPTCERGAVLFETSRGNLDASVDTQLREIERGLTDRF